METNLLSDLQSYCIFQFFLLIFATIINQIPANMRIRNILESALAIVIMAMVLSCGPVEPSTYTEHFYRIGTVRLVNGNASIMMDLDESFSIENFKTESDMKKFGVSDNDRVLAAMTLEAVGSMSNAVVTLYALSKIDTQKFAASQPSDTLNYYYQFTKFALYNSEYPAIWNVGHLVNVTPTYFVPEEHEDVKFQLYPLSFENDTLTARLYSYIPDCDVSLNPNYTQSLLCFDISSLRDSVSDSKSQEIRDTILARLERMENDKFTLTVITPDTLRAKNSKAADKTYIQPMPGLPKSISVPFDF